MSALEAARFGDEIGHTCAMSGLLTGLFLGLALVVAAVVIVGTGGVGAVFIGAAIAGVAGLGMAGLSIGATIPSSPKGPINSGSPDTFLGMGMRKAARSVVDTVLCRDHSLKHIAQGSIDVFINNEHAARRTDGMECSAILRDGQPDVFFGGPTGTYMSMDAEVPGWVVTVLTWAGWLGAGIATGGAIFTVGLGAALAGLAGSLWLGHEGAKLGGNIGEALGGATGRAIGEAVGGLTGAIVGGGLGARFGGALEARLPTATLARMPGATKAHIEARQTVVRDYMTRSPDYQPRSNSPADIAFARKNISNQMGGTDFTQPVRVRTLRQDTVYGQYQNRGANGAGNFIARPGTTPSEIGLGSLGRDYATGQVGPKQIANYTVPKGTRVLEARSAPLSDTWSVGGGEVVRGSGGPYYEPIVQPSRGGGLQTTIGDKGVMQPMGPPTNANPAVLAPGTPTTFSPGTTVPRQVTFPDAPVVGGAVNPGQTGSAIGAGVGATTDPPPNP